VPYSATSFHWAPKTHQCPCKRHFQGFGSLALRLPSFCSFHGYYVTTAFFGVIWRSTKPLVYPTISLSLFVVHTHIVFMRMGPDFTPEGRAMELPFAMGGAGIVFLCAVFGSGILNKWKQCSF
jgi:hypothetical protein